MTGFEAFAEALDEPRGWRTVDDVVVEGGGDIQELSRTEFAIDEAWFSADAADRELEGVVRGTDCPPGPVLSNSFELH